MGAEANPDAGENWAEIDELLNTALDLDDAARQAWLDQLGILQPKTAARLRQLLGLAERSDLIDNVVRGVVCEEALLELMDVGAGTRIGTWKLDRPLGVGGMSEVYLARRALESGEQLAALKLISAGMARPEALARFNQETAILSQLNDARIARLIDSGRAADGRPWLAMEYVDGEAIDVGCDRCGLSVKQRVKLLIEVARAVDHAHRHLVVHRDIKPGNVLLCREGAEIRLLDFGIAKILEPTNPEQTGMQTRAFTINFASPEQLAGKPVTTASDIYQLGVLLYILLTGVRPFRAIEGAPTELLAAMQEGPPRPSHRVLHDTDQSRPHCGLSPRMLSAVLHGDLDTIVLKAMDHDPQRRYLSARELAEDLQRWLRGDAILARPESLYRIGRRLRKHWVVVAASALSLALVVAYALTVTWQRQELRAERARIERILDTVTDMFSEADPFSDDATPATVMEVVEKTAQRYLNEADKDPEFQALMLERLAALKSSLRDFKSKQALLERALEIADSNRLPDKLRARIAFGIADSLFARGELASAQDALARHAGLLSRDQPLASALLQAKILLERGELAASERGFSALLAQMDDTGSTAEFQRSVYNSLGILRRRMGDANGAVDAYQRALALITGTTPVELEAQLTIRSNIAIALGAARRYRESDQEFTSQMAWAAQHLGDDHPAMATIARSYSTLLRRTLRFRTAHELLLRLEPVSAEKGSAVDRSGFLQARAWLSWTAGDTSEALDLAIDAAEKSISVFGARAPATQPAVEVIVWMLFELGADADAVRFADTLDFSAGGMNLARTALILSAEQGAHSTPVDVHRDAIAGEPCAQTQLTALRAALVQRTGIVDLESPATCDGYMTALVAALGVRWTPDWAGAFTPEPFASPLLRRIQSETATPAWRPDPAQRSRLDALLEALRAR
jgi:serine/threonine protein kinase